MTFVKFKRHIKEFCEHPATNMITDYETFKAEKDPFWSNIPHEKCQMVGKKKKSKYKTWHLKTTRPSYSLTKPALKRSRQKKLEVMKKKTSLSSMLPDNLHEICVVDKPDSRANAEAQTIFPLYVKSRHLYKIEIEDRVTLSKLKGAIEKKEKIPGDLQLLTHQGKLLRPSRLKNLERGDTIHVIVRGKGGGKGDEKSSPKKATSKASSTSMTKETNAGLSNVKTEDDVQKWLRDVVKVPKAVFNDSDLRMLDADTLRDYTEYRELKEELGVPIGISRKIIYLKDTPIGNDIVSVFKRESLELITSDDISSFALECLKKEKNIEKIKDDIKNEYIDGFVIMLYDDHSDLAVDLSISKAIARKLLINAKKNVKELVSNKTMTQETTDVSKDLSTKSPAQNVCENNDFLLEELGLQNVDNIPNESAQECQLFAIHSSWENCNELAQMFLFWILCKPDDFTSKQDRHKLWKSIVQYMPNWLETLPDEQKVDFTPGKSAGRFQYKMRKNVNVSEHGERIRAYNDVSMEERQRYKNHILIVNGSILSTSNYLLMEGKYVSLDRQTITMWAYGDEGIEKLMSTTSTSNIEEEEDVFKNEESSSLYNLSYFGDMKGKYDSSDKSVPHERPILFVRPRSFNNDGSTTIYFKGYVIERPECGSRTVIPSLEFKNFRSSLGTGNEMTKFLTETLRFACGCLNRRRNGTIFFGIADEQPIDGERHKHGQVVGFPIMEVDNVSKNRYTEELEKATCNCFDSPEAKEAARECIKAPAFVKVSPSSPELPLYVMEVDVEASSCFCKGIKFKLDLSKVHGKKQRPYLYLRDGAQTRKVDDDSEEKQFVSKMEDYDKQRQQHENVQVTEPSSSEADHKYMAEKLCRKICKGNARFDPTFWPILVSSKPTDEMKPHIFNLITFISHIHWTSVFEFDEDSLINGLCKHFFNTTQITHTDGAIFRDVENNNELRNRLRLPENSVFIFCNGRSDTKKPHLSAYDWKETYSPSIKAAVNFFQKKSVVPIGRAIIIFLLFSSDTEGFLDVYEEMTTFFGNDQVLLICPDRYVYDTFKQSALLQQKVRENALEKNSVVGMTWEQTNECINRLLGVENPVITCIPSSSGATVFVEKRVEESLDSLDILSSTKYEDNKFNSLHEKKQFSSEKELKFYQGNRVEWWNFFFEGHVMERNCFRRLKSKVLDALTGQNAEQKVKPIFLKHEPGAGGSTLARHVLWEFRKEFRCAVVTKLQDKTATDILSFWKYKEIDLKYAKPVLLLIDSVPEQKVDLDKLVHLITTQSWEPNCPVRSVCVFLICMRDELTNVSSRMQQAEMPVYASEFLPQKVEDNEKEWLKEKIDKLEDTSRDLGLTEFKGEYFITFMILHSNFNKDFLQGTVENLMKGMRFEEKSFKLLIYIALVIAYVSPSKGGAAIAFPIECCSELMGLTTRISTQARMTTLWENELEGPLKILLVIELKENGSGKQIRMAHPNLAKTVIDCVQVISSKQYQESEDELTLASIAMEFLECDILQTSSYAKTFVIRLCLEMLIRRKKEEYDDGETTKFSPLIESILCEHKSFEPAANVLLKGFEIFNDASIAQQLARLYLANKVYHSAKDWAKKAVQLNPNKSGLLHTLGFVCKLTFLNLDVWDTVDKKKSEDQTIIGALDLAFEALHLFQNACTCDKYEVNLIACLDILSTVNCIARFIYEVVDIGRKEVKYQYLTDEEYIPDSILGWKKYHLEFKALFSRGLQAVEILDEHIYFSRRSYASKYNPHLQEEHRSSRILKRRLPDMFKDFADFFGDAEDEDPPAYVKSDEMKDAWHRRCIITLGGKRLVDVFRLISFERTPAAKEKAISSLSKVQTHLNNIRTLSSSDYLNLIYVTLALAHLKAPNHMGMKCLFDFCEEIITTGRKGSNLNMAYLFSMMFQWPLSTKRSQEFQYNHVLMLDSMKHLFEEFRLTKHQKPKAETDFFKRENNVFTSIVLFYVVKGKGLSAFCHHTQLSKKSKLQDLKEDFWERPAVREKLRFISGFTRLRPNSGAISVVVDTEEYGIDQEIVIRTLRCRRPEMTERPVSFVLGFSLSGPVVCYIRPKDTSLYPMLHPDDMCGYNESTKRELLSLKREIGSLKTESNLNEKEKRLLEDEPLIDQALVQFDYEEGLLN